MSNKDIKGLRTLFYPPEVLEDIRTGNDIVDLISSYVSLKQRGSNFFGLCPFHNEKSASFSVSPDRQMYYCFGCGASGNVIGFVMQIENHDFQDAVRFLADRIHYSLPEAGFSQEASRNAAQREQLYEMNKLAARFFYDTLQESEAALSYLGNRGIGTKIRRRYGLGYSGDKWDELYKFLLERGYNTDLIVKSGLGLPNKTGGYRDRFVNRIMFPIFNAHGKIAGFGGRIITEGQPKYLNSPDTPIFDKSKNLYGINFARASRTRHFIIVEGYMDVISLAQAGFSNTVASLGTAFNKEHVGVLKKYADTVTLLFDSDDAGTAAALKAIPHLIGGGMKTRVLQVTDAKDPDEYINKFGSDRFSELLDRAETHVAFQISCIQKHHDITRTDGQVQFVREAAQVLAELDSSVEREVYAKEAARLTGISLGAIVGEIEKLVEKPLGVLPVKKRNTEYIREKTMNERGLRDAQKTILILAANDIRVYMAIKSVLQPSEMPEPVYARLLEIIYSTHEKRHSWYSAEALNYFTEVEEQRKVSEVFMNALDETKDDKGIEIAITNTVKRIKLYNIGKSISEEKSDSVLMDLLEKKRKVDNLNINLIE